MWEWLKDFAKWLASAGSSNRQNFESVTTRWRVMFDALQAVQKNMGARLEEVEKERDECRQELREMHCNAIDMKRKLGRVEDKLESALYRIAVLEGKA